jgi:hypothetical protein
VSFWGRALAAATGGAIVAALCLTVVTSARPGLSFGMHGPGPAIGRGFHGPERDGEVTLAWTAGEATLTPAGIDRAAPWSCTVRFRSGRPANVPRAVLLVSVDGAPAASAPAPDSFDDLAFSLPAARRRGAEIVLTSTPPFTPGGADTRELGVQIDRLVCAPASGWAWPPAAPLRDTALAAAMFTFVIVAAGGSIGAALLVAAAVSLGAAMMMTIGAGLFTPYSGAVLRTGLGVAGATGLVMLGVQLIGRARLSGWARFAIAASAVALFLKVIALLHPAKPVIDALFHAHRLERVMAGGWYFTQPFVGGVEMPYAIGLYIFALPWALATTDHVALIRIVTATADVAACLLIYPLILRVWDDRRVAAFAVLATQLAPLPYVILGNANLTNIFGQSLALATMVVATAMPVEIRRRGPWLLFSAVLTWALCSHVSTAATLACTLAVLASLFFLSGDAGLRRRAMGIAAGLAVAAAAAWLLFYRQFTDEFSAAFARMFSDAPAAGPAAGEAAEGYMTTGQRVWNLLEQAVTSAGIPLLILAALGLVALRRRRRGDPLTYALVAWTAVWAVFSISTVFARVDAEYVRYAAEFLGRINLATIPLAAILAARGATIGWDEPPPAGRLVFRAATIVLLGWATALAAHEWVKWFSR